MRPLLDRRTDGFSQGERMKTALARALVHDPANIVLDEPTNGLDVLATRALRESLRWLRTPAGGAKCIVFSTHIMQEVERLCDHVVVVADGRTVASGTRGRAAARRPARPTSKRHSCSWPTADRAPAGREPLGREPGRRRDAADAGFAMPCRRLACAASATVLRKELVDALRDRRTLLTVLLSAVLLGPLVLVALSALVATLEASAEKREVQVAGIEHAPTLVNFLERQTYTVKAAPPDYEAQLRSGRLDRAGARRRAGFRGARWRAAKRPCVEIVTDSANQRAPRRAPARLEQLLGAFGRERSDARAGPARRLARACSSRCAPSTRDLASVQTRAAQFTGMLPFFVMMAVLYGALNAALDTTAGERERGSLEPLLMNPAPRWALVVGKWGAVASVAMLIAALCSLSFIPAQWLLRSDTLAALFQYGLREAALFLLVLLPFAAALSALLMAVAIRCRSFKEAQASAAIVVLVRVAAAAGRAVQPGRARRRGSCGCRRWRRTC